MFAARRKGNEPEYVLTQHCAAVKAIAWCPFQRKLLASGGGASDHHVRFWDTGTGSQLTSIDAKSQVSLAAAHTTDSKTCCACQCQR
jgi:cell division cycle 20, cofactor of APC complex